MSAATSHRTPKLDPALCRLFAQYFLRDHELKPFIEWAEQQLVEGRDTSSLRILAGLSGDDSQEIEFYLKKSFQELSLGWPEEKICLLQLCGDIASDIVTKNSDPNEGYNLIYKVALHMNYPRELNRWLRLDIEFYPHEGAHDEKEQVAKCIVKEAIRFSALMEDYQKTNIFRLTPENSIKYIRDLGWDVPDDSSAFLKSMPSETDGELGLRFFRTNVHNAQFDYLTIPRTYFGRSEIKSTTFEHSDLVESRMCWNDWQYCHFAGADLSGCDLRRSHFEYCYFNGANLKGADLRGACFDRCSFSNAVMKGVKLGKQFGFLSGLKAKALKLSPEQAREIDWVSSAGEEPAGG